MTKTNTKMELEQFVANLMRNFFGFPTNGKFETFGESKARILEDNTIEFFIAEYKDIQIVESFSFSEFMEYLLKVQSEIEKRYEQLGAAHIGELYYGCSSSKSFGFEFFNDVLYHVLRFLSDKFSSTSEQNVREIVNDKIIEFLTNNPDERISDIDSLYEDCFEHLSDLESEYDVMLSDWEDSEYVDMALDNCSSFIHLLLVFKELDVNVNLNSEFKKNENSSGATRIVTVELELPSGNKLVFKKGEGKLKKALYYNLLQIVSDELSVEKVLKNIKIETEKEDKAVYDDLFKDFTFIQELKQKIEKLLAE